MVADASPGDELSPRTLVVQIDGDLGHAAVSAANAWDEPYAQPRLPWEQGESVLELFDENGAFILATPVPVIKVSAVPLEGASTPGVGPTFSRIFTIPDLPEIGGARIRVYEFDPEIRLFFPRYIDVEGLPDLAVHLETPIPYELLPADHLVLFGPAESFDVVLLAEGYTEAEQSLFESVASEYINHLLTLEPWNQYANRLNFRTIFRASPESGASTVEQPKETAYGLMYGGTIRKCPINIRERLPFILNDARWGAADMAAVLVNEEPRVTGANLMPGCTDMDSWLAVTGAHPGYAPWFKHEMEHWGYIGEEDSGHPGDGDEEGSPCSWIPDPMWRNLTGDPTCAQWEEWLGIDGVGCYPGGFECYDNAFHPGLDCGMSVMINRPVCPVCREAILLKLLGYTDAVKAASVTNYRMRPGQNVWLSILNKTENATIVWSKKTGTSVTPRPYPS